MKKISLRSIKGPKSAKGPGGPTVVGAGVRTSPTMGGSQLPKPPKAEK
jgi:hypothetical protein